MVHSGLDHRRIVTTILNITYDGTYITFVWLAMIDDYEVFESIVLHENEEGLRF